MKLGRGVVRWQRSISPRQIDIVRWSSPASSLTPQRRSIAWKGPPWRTQRSRRRGKTNRCSASFRLKVAEGRADEDAERLARRCVFLCHRDPSRFRNWEVLAHSNGSTNTLDLATGLETPPMRMMFVTERTAWTWVSDSCARWWSWSCVPNSPTSYVDCAAAVAASALLPVACHSPGPSARSATRVPWRPSSPPSTTGTWTRTGCREVVDVPLQFRDARRRPKGASRHECGSIEGSTLVVPSAGRTFAMRPSDVPSPGRGCAFLDHCRLRHRAGGVNVERAQRSEHERR